MISLRVSVEFEVEDYIGHKAAVAQLMTTLIDISFGNSYSVVVEEIEEDEPAVSRPANVSSLPSRRPANRGDQRNSEEEYLDEDDD